MSIMLGEGKKQSMLQDGYKCLIKGELKGKIDYDDTVILFYFWICLLIVVAGNKLEYGLILHQVLDLLD